MTPKSLLRHKKCVSFLEDFSPANSFHRILNDYADVNQYGLIKLKADNKIKKVILCSGKVYFDLIDEREKLKANDVIIYRIEQLYPFPVKTLGREIKRFKNAEFFWCQEEPKNMGAWNTVRNYIDRTMEIAKFSNKQVTYIGRRPSSSTATGNHNKHVAQTREILDKVFK